MYRYQVRLGAALAILVLAACSNQPRQPDTDPVADSGPPVPVDMLAAPEPTPVREPIGEAGNKSPYTVNGVTYRVRSEVKGYRERGHASWYGTKFHGRRTANGEVYNMYAMSAAHKTLPLPSYAKVTNLENGRSVIVRVNDRGPFVPGRIIDLSYTAAQKLGFIEKGVARVEVEALDPDSLPPAGDTLAVERDVAARAALAQDASFKLPPNTYLQVGAYGSAQKADDVRAQLAALIDYPVSVTPVDRGGRKLYRVRIGPIAQQRALVAARETVEQNRLGQPQVVYD
ncbi:septal ring lytic transglycosylase RlpA family protein [Microbulbifer thermotolerans]|uniref:Endolytic peptidoglycan transglycosylase RlpA n=1 Tax=Microbulbifer thermotolerans TaxID=252514 RepID=A0A143HJL8_MICTH|nr:septal ring lytic transglycosylase RlpA family protein [Microbulbifer thermotolerans]AMX01909.1 sugar fermentation stimulation protein [Microbulbifer thermotolerans]MCX2779187.1 septal ring lytic transglycosylase RlpA family protein [Microbulbifer thermotolerans]MCX2781710.1 septal ring lytic transglycosylase RlpA family protein [Microbulbifer thermotolerans]MCX2793582.1 septal ring lytic transglycosylase RlpA family protein [Microbulbifer thermotolerans]MCX2801548.1 septal ring lytic trans